MAVVNEHGPIKRFCIAVDEVRCFSAASQQLLDAAYCYRWSSVVCLCVCVCVSFGHKREREPCKTVESIEGPTRVGLRNHVFDGVQISPT